jgi:hypothetical protein
VTFFDIFYFGKNFLFYIYDVITSPGKEKALVHTTFGAAQPKP